MPPFPTVVLVIAGRCQCCAYLRLYGVIPLGELRLALGECRAFSLPACLSRRAPLPRQGISGGGPFATFPAADVFTGDAAVYLVAPGVVAAAIPACPRLPGYSVLSFLLAQQVGAV